ncbi:MAG: MerR family transcriptional regulator [Thermodesulfovibrionales bacterium]|nr:MerR family transcriptional regulator [Thermodesulfovibrionales bacterium]
MKNGNVILDALQKKNGMPLYTIGVVSELVGTTNQTLRIYEKHGLLKPARKNKNRLYSVNDIRWILCIREMIHNRKLSIEGIKKLLEYAPCWELMNCPEKERNECAAFVDRTKACWELNRRFCTQNGSKTCETCIVYQSKSREKSKTKANEKRPKKLIPQ